MPEKPMKPEIAREMMQEHQRHLSRQAETAVEIFLEAFKEFKDSKKAMHAALMALDVMKDYKTEGRWFWGLSLAEEVMEREDPVEPLEPPPDAIIILDVGSLLDFLSDFPAPPPQPPSRANPRDN